MATRNDINNANFVIGSIILALLMFLIASVCHASEELPKWRAVYAAIGEAESEGLDGMRAVMSALRNRAKIMKNPFKGVYGEKSARVKNRLYSSKTLVLAVQAWEESATHDYVDGATGWGNANDVKIFKTKAWWKNCRIVKQVGNHYFYKEIR